MSEPKIDSLIRIVRGQRVILDADLASLYGVPTKLFYQAFRRNRKSFPPEFAFQLTWKEFALMDDADNEEHPDMWPQNEATSTKDTALQYVRGPALVASVGKRGTRRVGFRPWVFTEHGALMAANILKSPRAREMSIFIVRAFLKLREEVASNLEIMKRLAEIDRTLLEHDTALRDLYHKLLPLLEPPPEIEKEKIGFHRGNR